MKLYSRGWVEKKDVFIPPIKKKGFAQDVLIRRYIPPLNREETAESVDGAFGSEDPTVLIHLFVKEQAYIKRIKTGEMKPIVTNNFIVGKSLETDYMIRDNPTVSRKHAKIEWREDEYWLVDLQSKNHVFVNGEQITGSVRLINEMKFRLSEDEEFQFLIKKGNEG